MPRRLIAPGREALPDERHDPDLVDEVKALFDDRHQPGGYKVGALA